MLKISKMGGSLMLWHLLLCKEEIKRRKALRKTNRNENNPGPSGRRHHAVNVKTEKKDYEQSTCRVCLQYGDIPIYGVVDVSEELKLFTGIEITPGDSYPHYLCDFCSNQLEGAVTLRRSAQNSDRLLKQATQNIINNTVGNSGIFVQANCGSSSGTSISHQENDNDDDNDGIQESKENDYDWFYTIDQTENIKIHDVDEGEPKKKRRRKFINKDNTDLLHKFTECKQPNVMFEEVKPKTFHCVKCNIDFKSKKEYSKHRQTHRNDRNKEESCPICNKVFDNRGLSNHMATHKKHEKKLFMCDVCGKEFKNKTNFDRHHSKHFLTELPFKCPECPYQGRFRADLNFHMRIHTNDKRYQCPQCPTRFFINKSNLSRHMLTHRTDYDFNCDQCQRGYYTKKDLELHFRVDHDGIKEHVCDDCGKAFGFRKTLMKHERQVHKRAKMRSGRTPLYLLLESKKQQEVKSLQETSGQECNFKRERYNS